MAPRYTARTRVSHQPGPPCYLQRLSADTLVDDVFIYLHVEDVLCLRRVNKAFYILSHTPSIWKRLLIRLQRLRYPIPPLPPLQRNTFSNIDLDVEQLVIRSITVDENWKSTSSPRLYNKALINAGACVVDMKLAPGGKYLLVSTNDASNQHCYLTVFLMDHPDGPQALARVHTTSKAYHLEVRYANLWGCWGLWVAFVRRALKLAPDKDTYGGQQPVYEYYCNIDLSDLSHETEIDPPPGYVIHYEVVCYHIPLETLEMLSDPRLFAGCPQFIKKVQDAPEPFNDIGGFVSVGAISNITVFQYQSKPRFVAKLGDKCIICAAMVDPNRNELSIMSIAPVPNFEHNEYVIEAVHPIPNQGSLLVARKIHVGREFCMAALEIYDIPTTTGQGIHEAKHRLTLTDRDIVSIQISGCESPITVPEEILSSGPPDPISIYVRMKQPGVSHYSLYPALVNLPINKFGLGPRRYRFTLDEKNLIVQSVHLTRPYDCRVLPAVHRSILYNLLDAHLHPAVANIRRHHSASNVPADEKCVYKPPVLEDEQVTRHGRPKVPKKIYVTVDTPGLTDEINQNGGLSAITWDEGIGRLCFATGNDSSIRMLDYGQSTHPDSRLQKWKAELADRERRREIWEDIRYF
ncbi:hypothetical protein BDQ17DRAFT_1352725 [Cyathus striatus]|nr:hypothetical protein BDQ17DRAFT_1352725 [Cyathus striatus]